MTMNLSWIEDFMALAATGNFSRAADERHMTQPAFSRRIRALEEWLGAELFDRSSQPARVTETGEWFRTVAQELQLQVAALPGEARAVAEASSGTLRFASTHALSFTFLPRWLQTLEAQAAVGHGRLQLLSDVQQQGETLLLHNQVDFLLSHGHALVRGPLEEAEHPHLVVGHDQLLPVSAPDAAGGPLHALGYAMPWLGYSAESGLGRLLRALKGPQLDRLHAPPVMTAHLASVLRTMALAGRGLAWLPRLLVDEDLRGGRLVVAAPAEWHLDLQIRLYRQCVITRPAARAFWTAASTVHL